jgi:hypothetical protein
MVRLNELSLEAFEAMSPYLKDWHVLRLYSTGDKRIQSLVAAVRTRFFSDSFTLSRAPIKSRLVTRLLMDGASSLQSDWRNVIKLADLPANKPSNIRYLRLTDISRDASNTPSPKRMNAVIKRMPLLDTLRTHLLYPFGSALALPPTITDLSLSWSFRYNISTGIKSLPLVTLGLSFDNSLRHVDESTFDWMPSAAWHGTLASLWIGGNFTKISRLAGLLPPNLTEFEIGDGGKFETDLGELMAGQTCLERLVTGDDWCIQSPLPETLTELKIGALVSSDNAGVEFGDMVQYLPKSLSSLNISRMEHYDCVGGPDHLWKHAADQASFVTRILGRLDLESAIRTVMMHSNTRVDNFATTSVEKLLVKKLRRAGYSPNHVRWIRDGRLNSLIVATDSSVALLFRLGIRERHDVALYLKDKANFHSFGHELGDYYESSLKCLEWGYCRHLTLSGTLPPPLSSEMLTNLKKIEVVTADMSILRALLDSYSFDSVNEIGLQLPDVSCEEQVAIVDAFVGIVLELRQQLQLLEVIRIAHWTLDLGQLPGMTRVKLLEEMRLYHVPNTCIFLYRTISQVK